MRALLAGVAALSMLAAACGGPAPGSEGSFRASLDGGGSSFQDALQQGVKAAFAKAEPGITVNYTKSGSGQGKRDLADQTIDYAGTDSPVKAEEKEGFKGGELLYFPVAASPITLTANVAGISSLRLDATLIAGIFEGHITRWNDPGIRALNGSQRLPSTMIVPVHRSDRSGTTANFTRYLSVAAPEVWSRGSGDEVRWGTPTAAEKNSGVASLVSTTDGAIGYIDLVDAVAVRELVPTLTIAEVRNNAGNFVQPKLPGATAALESSALAPDLTFDSIDAPGEAAYPLTAPTWVLTYAHYDDSTTAEALRRFLTFFLTDGQELAGVTGYARLPPAMADRALAQVDRIT